MELGNKILDDGVPRIFFGSMEYVDGSRGPEAIYSATLENLKQGIRHIDCAELYSESIPHVARALVDSGVPRNEIFFCTKIKGLPVGGYNQIKERIQTHISSLGLDYVDLLLVHWPGPSDCDFNANIESFCSKATWEYFDQNIDVAWDNAKRLEKDGLAQRIGVSNFYQEHLERIPGTPYANQIYVDITHPEYEFIDYMLARGVHVLAYRSLIFLGAVEMAASMGDTTFSSLVDVVDQTHADSVQQVVIAWLLARGCSVVVKSSTNAHIASNLEAYDLVTSIDVNSIKELSKHNNYEIVTMCGGVDEYAMAFRSQNNML